MSIVNKTVSNEMFKKPEPRVKFNYGTCKICWDKASGIHYGKI
jgi:hypothetical protein